VKAKSMIVIDGSFGEGGGQILRSSLSLSLLTGQPFRIERIRARRKSPGLLRQHLTSVRAAVDVGAAEVAGAEPNSQELTFVPRTLRGATFSFAIGTAGSTMLVLQTILVPLLIAKERSEITLEGGTHNPLAPPYEFLTTSFLPLLARMGAKVTIDLVRPGFYPAGGGCVRVAIEPATRLQPIELIERGALKSVRARACVANLPYDIAKREIEMVAKRMQWPESSLHAHTLSGSRGPGNVLSLEAEHEHVAEVVTGFGERGVRAEDVAVNAIAEMNRYLWSNAAVGVHLADQLLLPMAIAGGGAFTTLEPSLHTTTNAEVIRKFTGVNVAINEAGKRWRVEVTR